MSSALPFLPQPDEKPLGAWRATIASAPATVTEPVMVTIPAYTSDLQWGPCRWQPRYEPATVNVAEGAETAHNIQIPQLVLPQRGDDALIAFDENDEPWVLLYQAAP